MVSDLEIVRACAASYAQAPSIPQASPWMPYVVITPAADGETLLVINRGSDTWQDWLRDFLFTPAQVRTHPQLGPCHAGFLEGAESIVDQLANAINLRPYIIAGHSLGGAEAIDEAALLICRGWPPPRAIVTFGAPRVGMAPLVKFMAPYAVRQYVRGNDLVPTEPAYDAPLFEFVDTRWPGIPVGHVIGSSIPARLACHHIDGYVADVGAYLAADAAA